ncbi:putative integral membrane protein [Theileria parva strain Muguga]|uniref:putative integral membrane protein n=1 Tax=Theileria parva strain Muguga TaxID=333668 RepID=UPI001C61B58E|nr:putative integral membrane protein [Theileria parva strain Muguga]EAN31408.2 putative integral membrane protein [Theileria parva strain Muguga]
MALWGYNFNREVKWQKNRKGFGIFYISAMFIFPSLIYYVLGNPAVSNFYLKNVMPVEYPKESDPSIISNIYYGNTDKEDSVIHKTG